MIHADRTRVLNKKKNAARASYVLYWMQQSQRADFNHALEYAVREANQLGKKIVVVFGLDPRYPQANMRHYCFMIEGLRDTRAALARRGIKLAICPGSPEKVALRFSGNAVMMVCDRGYLRHQRAWRRHVARHAPCKVVQVESDVVVPVETASDKCEYAARFLRPKLQRLMHGYLDDVPSLKPRHVSLEMRFQGELDIDSETVFDTLGVDHSVRPVSELFRGGNHQAIKRLAQFVHQRLQHYTANRNQPQTDDVSHMGMYLHFGQISPVYIARKILDAKGVASDFKEAFIEELVVRRELAVNYVYYKNTYDSFDGLPDWAAATLHAHCRDKREFLYSRDQLENAQTHDPYWNAAADEMKFTGYMHNYMRMYWVKKIIEWSETPRDAYETAVYLNNRYFIDGRDPNSYAGVSWGFGLHDRPWKEREIFGKVRYMNAAGLRRKCDIDGYVEKVNQRVARLGKGAPERDPEALV